MLAKVVYCQMTMFITEWEWVQLSEFLKNPHKAEASMHSISSVANAKPDWKSSKSRGSGGESNKGCLSIVFDIIDWFW